MGFEAPKNALDFYAKSSTSRQSLEKVNVVMILQNFICYVFYNTIDHEICIVDILLLVIIYMLQLLGKTRCFIKKISTKRLNCQKVKVVKCFHIFLHLSLQSIVGCQKC